MTDTPSRDLTSGVDLWGVVALGLGSAMGVAIFSAIGPAAAMGGPAMLISVIVAALPMVFVAVTYAFMGSQLPTSGASYEWPRRFLNPALGFGVAWLRIAANTGALVVLALVLTRYLAMVSPVAVPVKPTMFVLFVLALIPNLLGVGIASGVQKTMMALLLLVFGLFCAWGVAGGHMHWEHLRLADGGHGFAGMLTTIPLLVGLFFGIESATEMGDEIRDNKRMITLGIALSIGSAVAVYLAVASVALGAVGATELGTSKTPLLDAAQVIMGPVATPIIVLAAVLAIGKSLNGIFMVFSRSLYAMGKAGALPAVFARVHPRFRTPYVACLAVFACACAGLLLPTELTFLFLAVNVPTLLKYACVCLSADRVITRHPELATRARFPLSHRAVRICAYLGMATAGAILLLGLGADWRPYAALAAWGAVGAVVYVARRFTVRRNPAPESL